VAFVCRDVSRDPCGYIGSSQFGASSRNEFISSAFGIGRGCNIEFNAPLSALSSALTALNASFTRASVKNVLQGSSLVQLAANQFGTALDPSTGLYGANIEGAATNLVLRNTDNSNDYWVYTNGSCSGSAITAPDGTSTAYPYVEAASTTSHYVGSGSITVTSGTTYTYSGFFKPNGRNVVQFTPPSSQFSGTSYINFDATSISVTASSGTSNHVMFPVGSGWFYIAFSIAATATGGDSTFRYGPQSSTTAGRVAAYAGDGTSGVCVWGGQLETGTVSTSPILTTGSTATRAAEKLVVPLWKNNVLYSQDPSGTGWSRTNITLTGSQADPFGASNAWKVEATASASTTFYASFNKAVSTTMTASVYVKGGTAPAMLQFVVRNVTTATNFQAGTFTQATGAISGAGWTSTAVPGYAGWYRLTFTQASGVSVGDSISIQMGFVSSSMTAGDHFYMIAPQLEAGSTATTYVPTTSTLDVTGNANIPGFSSAGYTLAADFRSMAARTTAAGLIELNDNLGSNRSNLLISSSDLFNPNSVTGGASQMSIAGSACTATRRKGAASYQVNNFLAANNGTALTPDTSGTMPTGMYLLNLGSLSTGGSPFNGYLYRLQLIPKVLTQAQLNGLTQ